MKAQRYDWLQTQIQNLKYKNGAEIGVKSGGTTIRLLRRIPELRMVAVDLWEPQEHDQQGPDPNNPKSYAGHGWDHDRSEKRFRTRGKQFVKEGRLQIIKGNSRSQEVLDQVPDGSLDFVFIDADHTKDGCLQDIRNWRPKVRPGGMISGHDVNWPGVAEAVRTEVPQYQIWPQDWVWFGGNMPHPLCPHFVIVDRLKVVFMLAAKAATTSVKRTLWMNGYIDKIPRWKDFHVGFKYGSPDDLPGGYTKIAIKRNPRARILSAWAKHRRRMGFAVMGFPKAAPFPDFVEFACGFPDESTDPHLRSLDYSWGGVEPDIILECGRLNQEWERLQRELGRSLPELLRMNTSNHKAVQEYYSGSLNDMVFKRYRRDFERFGYERP